jgi:cytochrome c oxidase subunit 2
MESIRGGMRRIAAVARRAGRALVVCAALSAGCAGTEERDSGRLRNGERVVEVTAERFQFRPSTIRVRSGEKVRVLLHSDDTTHGFAIDDLGVDVRIPPSGRGSAVAEFVAPAPGTYAIRCSHICGAGHAQMRGRLVVR